MHSTSVGKVLVVHLPKHEVEAILREHGLTKRTPKTITSQPRFFSELEKVRVQGYAVDDEENSTGARCVAAPIFDSLGTVEAALGVSGTTSQIGEANIIKIADLVKEAARKISKQLARAVPAGLA